MIFNNIYAYNEHQHNAHIPDAAIPDLYDASQFALYRGTPITRRVTISIPDVITEEGERAFYRYFVQKLRVHAADNNYPAVLLMARRNDPVTHANREIGFLVHVPDKEQAKSDKVVSKWRCSPTVTPACHKKTVLPDGTVVSDFNELFSALSPALAHKRLELPYRPSGLILGHRTFYSRCLWRKYRSAYYQSLRSSGT